MDADEPEQYNTVNIGWTQYSAGLDEAVGMAFPRMHHQGGYDGMISLNYSDGDFVFLSRSAWAGSQHYGAAVWSGDINSSFSELAIQVKVAQGIAMSGIYLWTTDVGGYENGDPQDPVFRELVVRWYQFGAFCPLFRTHGKRAGGPPADQCGSTNGPNEVWEFGERAYKAITTILHLRENLRDYVYTHFMESSQFGTPLVRPMAVQFSNDESCLSPQVEDQYMFGPDWLVAPVTTYQARSRSVYLPRLSSNQTWTHFFTNQNYHGGQRVHIATPLDTFPLFFRNLNSAMADSAE